MTMILHHVCKCVFLAETCPDVPLTHRLTQPAAPTHE